MTPGTRTTRLQVIEVGDDERITYEGRFDEDDFEGAYGGLERRYYAGEGAAFAEASATVTDYAIAMNRSEFDRVFGELTCADFRLENRSRSGFGDRSAAELRATYEDLTAMVASARMWHSALLLAVADLGRRSFGARRRRAGRRAVRMDSDRRGRDPRRAGRVGVPVRARRRGGGVRLRRGADPGRGRPTSPAELMAGKPSPWLPAPASANAATAGKRGDARKRREGNRSAEHDGQSLMEGTRDEIREELTAGDRGEVLGRKVRQHAGRGEQVLERIDAEHRREQRRHRG